MEKVNTIIGNLLREGTAWVVDYNKIKNKLNRELKKRKLNVEVITPLTKKQYIKITKDPGDRVIPETRKHSKVLKLIP